MGTQVSLNFSQHILSCGFFGNSIFRTHYIKNLTSAKVSMPDQVIEATVNDSPLCQWVSLTQVTGQGHLRSSNNIDFLENKSCK